jgi:hypothetical protein
MKYKFNIFFRDFLLEQFSQIDIFHANQIIENLGEWYCENNKLISGLELFSKINRYDKV